MSDPTIVVKKTDGSTVRMTMAEFRVYQAGLKSVAPSTGQAKTPAEPQSTKVTSVAPRPMKKTVVVPSTRPVTARPQSSSRPPVPAWNTTDHTSLLEEPLVQNLPMVSTPRTLTTAAPVTHIFTDEAMSGKKSRDKSGDTPTATIAAMLQLVGWQGTPEDQKRLVGLIDSRIKDVRSDDQFLAYAMTPKDRGGAGLTLDVANSILAAIKKKSPVAASPKPVSEQPQLKRPDAGRGTIPLPPPDMPFMAISMKPQVQDIKPAPEKTSVGPAEEFATMRVSDFVRLGPTIPIATAKLKEKFDVWKQESFIFFLEVCEGWYRSPLYTSYIALVEQALRERKTIAALIASIPPGQSPTLNIDICMAMNEINQYLHQ